MGNYLTKNHNSQKLSRRLRQYIQRFYFLGQRFYIYALKPSTLLRYPTSNKLLTWPWMSTSEIWPTLRDTLGLWKRPWVLYKKYQLKFNLNRYFNLLVLNKLINILQKRKGKIMSRSFFQSVRNKFWKRFSNFTVPVSVASLAMGHCGTCPISSFGNYVHSAAAASLTV